MIVMIDGKFPKVCAFFQNKNKNKIKFCMTEIQPLTNNNDQGKVRLYKIYMSENEFYCFGFCISGPDK